MPPLGKRGQLSLELQFTEMLHFLYAIYAIAPSDMLLKMVIEEMVKHHTSKWFLYVDYYVQRWTDFFVQISKKRKFLAVKEQHFRRLRASKVRRFENTFAEDWALDILNKSKQE